MTFRLGDIVREHGGRHEGVVCFVQGYTTGAGMHATIVRVRWCDTGFKTDFHTSELVLVQALVRAGAERCPSDRPRTYAESPRRQLERYFAEKRAS